MKQPTQAGNCSVRAELAFGQAVYLNVSLQVIFNFQLFTPIGIFGMDEMMRKTAAINILGLQTGTDPNPSPSPNPKQ